MGEFEFGAEEFFYQRRPVVGQKLDGDHVDLPFGIQGNVVFYQPHFRGFGDFPFFGFIDFILRQVFAVGADGFHFDKREQIAFSGDNIDFGDFGAMNRAQKKISFQNLIAFPPQMIRRDPLPQRSGYFCIHCPI